MNYGPMPLLPDPEAFPDEAALAEFVLAKMDRWFHIEEQVHGRYWTGEQTRIDAVLRPRDPDGWHDAVPAFAVEFKTARPSSVGDGYGWVAQAVAYTHCEWDGYGVLPVFLCPSPLTGLLARADAIASYRQRQIHPDLLEAEQEKLRRKARRFGSHYTEAYVDSQALIAHRQRIGEMNFEEFTARADGYANADAREREHQLRVAEELSHVLGQLSVGDLMPYKHTGWTLRRSGRWLWSERDGRVKVPYKLRPRIGSFRRDADANPEL
ncbi:hypothetical protein [Nocardioides luteus]|uniref:hypothetical protein n=1 Tax=Nocardioides luteus TaxID=1844 RepID=UPI000AA3B8DF|nr:hypothetical protein [Nocardioides luteus]